MCVRSARNTSSPVLGESGNRRSPAGVAVRTRGFTVLELLASVSIIGTMAMLLLPVVQSARESGRRAHCENNLKQLGVAIHARYMVTESFPPGWQTVPDSSTAYGWATFILDQLDLADVAGEIDTRAELSGPEDRAALGETLAVFVCPSDLADSTFALFAEEGDHEEGGQSSEEVLMELPAANYIGVFGVSDPDAVPGATGEGVFIENRQFRLAQLRNGATHVLFVGERTARKLPASWLGIDLEGEDAAGRMTGQAYLGPNRDDADECEFDSRHTGGANFLYGDGHVTLVADDVDPQVYHQSARRGE